MNVSVVIPTFNRANLLTRTLPALLNQQTDGFSYEVIFVINGSSDSTLGLLASTAARFPEKLRYKYLNPTGGPSAPRNAGIRMAAGDVIIILDDDVLPEPDLILQHYRYHCEHPDKHSAALGYVYIPEELMDDPMSFFHTFPYHEVQNRGTLSYLYFWTCNISFKRDFMRQEGMFDETFLYYEDIIVGHRLADAGMQLRFVPRARGRHLHQMIPADLPRKGRFLGRWLVPFSGLLPERAVKVRFGILSQDIGFLLLARRVVNRCLFRIADNPLTKGVLRHLGAENGKRSRISDAYYFLIFRGNFLAGYYEALREQRSGNDVHWEQANSQYAEKASSNASVQGL